MKNPCKECEYYHPENNTCQSKKCATTGDGYVTFIDRLFCKPYKAGKWIPVTERKPKVEQLVWLYTKDNAKPYNVFVGYLNEHGWWVECGVNYSEYSQPCIVAWQPLNKPEPYNCEARMVEDDGNRNT